MVTPTMMAVVLTVLLRAASNTSLYSSLPTSSSIFPTVTPLSLKMGMMMASPPPSMENALVSRVLPSLARAETMFPSLKRSPLRGWLVAALYSS